MTEKTGIVFSVAEVNEPHQRSVIENTVYENYGYQIRHYSIAANASVVPERYTHHTIYFVDRGELHIEYKVNDVRTEMIVPQGMSIIRPADMLCGFRADEDCVYTELILPNTSNMSPDLKEWELFRLPDLISFRQNGTVIKELVDDPDLKFKVCSMDEGTRFTLTSDLTYIYVTVLSGEGYVVDADDVFKLTRPESYCTRDKEVTISSVTKIKMMVLCCR